MAVINPKDIPKILADFVTRFKKIEIRLNQGTFAVRTGLAVDRPATPDLSTGNTTSYYSYDTKVLSVWNTDTDSWNTVTLT